MAFQLNAADFKTGNFLMDGALKKVVDALNKLDLDKDGKPDISEGADLVTKILPVLAMLNAVVDFNELAAEVANSKWVKDKEKFKACILQLGKLIEEIAPVFNK